MSPATDTACPDCTAPGKSVRAITLRSLLSEAAHADVRNEEGWRHCAAAGCSTAYFHPGSGARFASSNVKVRIGTKEKSGPRPVCYCFGHTVEEIDEEIARTGESTIGDRITERCRAGLDRCAETNPQGSCCLGNVRAAERGGLQKPAERPGIDCCAASCSPGGRGGAVASIGAMASAVLSSACCWLPLLLLTFGLSAGGVAAFVEAYRPWLLGITVLLLAVAFRLTYRAPATRLATFNKVVLWIATVVVIAFAAFPSYVSRIVGKGAAQPGSRESMRLRIEGMTCEGCTAHVRAALEQVPGVSSARVSYVDSAAEIDVASGVDAATLLAALSKGGYRASVEEHRDSSRTE